MKISVNYHRNKHQREFDQDLTTKFLHLSSGFGGGKTFALCQKLLKLSFLNRPFGGGLMCPTYSDFKRDVYYEMCGILESNNIPYNYNHSQHIFTFPWSKGPLFVVTAERKLRGPNWAYGGINELTLCSLERYREFIGRVRVRGAKVPQVCSVGTPEGLASEYYEIFVEKPWDNARVIYGDTRDNLDNLDKGYITALENSYDKQMLAAYLEGQWVNLSSNLFYYAFDIKAHCDRSITRLDHYEYHVAMDFNVSPMTATIWRLEQDKKGLKLIGFDEITLEGADTKQMAHALYVRGYEPHLTTLYPDPAGRARSTKGAPDIKQLEDAGFYNIKVKKKAPTHRERQLNVNNLLDKGRIIINPDTMPGMKRDLLNVEMNPVRLEKEKKNLKLTHYSDGLDYMCDILFPYSGVKPNRSEIFKVR